MSELMNGFRRLELVLENNRFMLDESINDAMKEMEDIVIRMDKLSTPKTETRVYLIDSSDERVEDISIIDLTNEEFIFEAEEQGKIYTLDGFAIAFNNEEINSNTDFIRIIEVPVSL